MALLKWIGGIVLLVWLLGFIFKIAGGFVHLLLIVAVIVFLVDFITSRRKG